jgi:hypothetical protein
MTSSIPLSWVGPGYADPGTNPHGGYQLLGSSGVIGAAALLPRPGGARLRCRLIQLEIGRAESLGELIQPIEEHC